VANGAHTDPFFQLNLNRADLPNIFEPGMSRAQMMKEAYIRASAILDKYVGGFRYTPEQASAVLSEIDGWVSANRPLIESTMANPALDTLPEQIQFRLGTDKAQSFIVAGFVSAAQGYATWSSGAVDEWIVAGKLDDWSMSEDLAHRLEIFLSIIAMEQRGELDRIFHPEKYPELATEGGAQAVIIVAILIIAVVAAATLVIYSVAMERTESANRVHEKICEWAVENEDRELMKKCADQAQEIRKISPGSEMWSSLGPVLLGVGGIFVASVYGVPALINALFGRTKT